MKTMIAVLAVVLALFHLAPPALAHPVQLKFTARVQPPGSELMEFICNENNQYGVAADIPNIYRDKGYGLEVQPPAQK